VVECERREEDKKLYDQKVQWLIDGEVVEDELVVW
jgi:hypothetical protein